MGVSSPEKFNIFGVASVSPQIELGNPFRNVEYILKVLENPKLAFAKFIVFPELSVTGYTCADLFFQQSLLDSAKDALALLTSSLPEDNRLIAVGVPLQVDNRLFNCAAVICNKKILGFVPKSYIPNYQEFYEKRWFASGLDIKTEQIEFKGSQIPFGTDLLFSCHGINVGIEICEDLWVPSPPSSSLCKAGAQLILNLSATDDNIGKYEYIRNLVRSQSARCRCAYAYASAGVGESSTDLVFSGINLIAVNGRIIGESPRFRAETSFAEASVDFEKILHDRTVFNTFFPSFDKKRDFTTVTARTFDQDRPADFPITVEPHPFIPDDASRDISCEEIINIQSWGLAQRLRVIGCKNIVVGISGGLDSTLALLIASHAFKELNYDPKGIIAVTMPSKATSSRTHSNAIQLINELKAKLLEIPIKEAVDLHFKDIDHDPSVFDAVYENSQARERTQILMDLANKYDGIVLGTGDMSELALGWCTYNGDHMSMYNVNAGVPKTLVKYLVCWFADHSHSENLKNVIYDIVDTPISPELVPSADGGDIAQKTEELVGPYELHDFFLFYVLRYGFSPSKIFFLAKNAFRGKYESGVIKNWLKNFYLRFFSQQFKRSCMPDGPKIGSVCLSPRGDWRMPSDASAKIWIEECDKL